MANCVREHAKQKNRTNIKNTGKDRQYKIIKT